MTIASRLQWDLYNVYKTYLLATLADTNLTLSRHRFTGSRLCRVACVGLLQRNSVLDSASKIVTDELQRVLNVAPRLISNRVTYERGLSQLGLYFTTICTGWMCPTAVAVRACHDVTETATSSCDVACHLTTF